MGKDSDNARTFREIDALIIKGESAEAAEAFKRLKTAKLSADERVEYATLARRLSLPVLALKLLKPIVRPAGRMKAVATDEEKAGYAGALIKVGALTEALDILNHLEGKKDPKVILFQAFAHIKQWDYASAIPFLRQYIESPAITHYQRLVGESNLCDALDFVEAPDAEEVIQKTLKEAKAHSYTIVAGRALLAAVDLYATGGKIPEAEKALAQAGEIFKKTSMIESFFVKKWTAIIALYKNASADSLSQLEAVREEARTKWKHWETIRDCDFHQAIKTNDLELQKCLYYGTPHESFRQRLLLHAPNLKARGDTPYAWKISRNGTASKVLEPFSGTSTFRKKLLESSPLNHRLFRALCSDFYSPMRVAILMSHLYPGEYFNYASSPRRIWFVVAQLRDWLADMKVPLEIEECDGAYHFRSRKGVMLLLAHCADLAHPELDLLKESLAGKEFFTVNDVELALSVSRRSANRLLETGLEKGLLVRTGKAKATKYSWKLLSAPKLAA